MLERSRGASGAAKFLIVSTALYLLVTSGYAFAVASTNIPISLYYTIGDSIAKSLMDIGVPGRAEIGIGPAAVRDIANGLTIEMVKGKTVILSSGASNNTDENTIRTYIPQQIQRLKTLGANVILLGVGSKYPSSINALLQKIASENGATFSYLTDTTRRSDGVHPSAKDLFAALTGGTPPPTVAYNTFSPDSAAQALSYFANQNTQFAPVASPYSMMPFNMADLSSSISPSGPQGSFFTGLGNLLQGMGQTNASSPNGVFGIISSIAGVVKNAAGSTPLPPVFSSMLDNAAQLQKTMSPENVVTIRPLVADMQKQLTGVTTFGTIPTESSVLTSDNTQQSAFQKILANMKQMLVSILGRL